MHKEKDNSFAKRQNGVRIHISEAISGRKGYFCLACSNEMQAVVSRSRNRVSYFRHDAKDMLHKPRCTYSDLSERHKIAKEIVIQLKRIKVPAIYKYPPPDNDGLPYRICNSRFIEAFKVLTERYFYEDANANIHWGDKNESPELHFLAKADVVFLDQKENPILLIEFVARHGLKDDAKVRMKSLGIDTVQVRVPREPEAAIRKIFETTEYTKWIYNYEQERCKYNRVSDTDPESISIVDELQREFFEENFYCRRSEITRLIRSINRFLESKQYQETQDRFESEISRIEQETIGVKQQLVGLQERSKNEIRNEFESAERKVADASKELSSKEDQIDRLIKDLEARYQRKAKRIETEKAEFESRVDKECREKGDRGSTIAKRKGNLEGQITAIERDIRDGTTRIEKIQRQTESLPEEFREEEARLRAEYERYEEEQRRTRLTTDERIRQRDPQRNSELPGRHEAFTDIRRIIDDSIEKQGTLTRNRKAWESLRSGAWKNWNEYRGVSDTSQIK